MTHGLWLVRWARRSHSLCVGLQRTPQMIQVCPQGLVKPAWFSQAGPKADMPGSFWTSFVPEQGGESCYCKGKRSGWDADHKAEPSFPAHPTPQSHQTRSEPQERGLRSKHEVSRIRDQGTAYIEGTVPFTLHTRCHLILTILEGGTAILQTLQIWKLSHREVKQLPQRHTVRRRAQIPTERVKLLTTGLHGLNSTGSDALTWDNMPWSSQEPRDVKWSRTWGRPGNRDFSGPLTRMVELMGWARRCCPPGHTRHAQGPAGRGSALERWVMGSSS